MIVNDYAELCTGVIEQDNWPLMEKYISKHTNCGASIQKIENGVKIGSIVEGVDGDGTEYHDLTFPFDTEDFWDKMNEVELEAAQIWNETHGCEECPEGEIEGYNRIAPDCPNCNGQGVIL